VHEKEGTGCAGHSHSHSQSAEEKSQVLVFLFGDFLHNFTDGIALGASYSYSISRIEYLFLGLSIGVSTTLAILMHETPHEIGDFAYLIKKKYSLTGIFSTQVATSMGCLCGAFVGNYNP
jgi:zinc transporter ZupT